MIFNYPEYQNRLGARTPCQPPIGLTWIQCWAYLRWWIWSSQLAALQRVDSGAADLMFYSRERRQKPSWNRNSPQSEYVLWRTRIKIYCGKLLFWKIWYLFPHIEIHDFDLDAVTLRQCRDVPGDIHVVGIILRSVIWCWDENFMTRLVIENEYLVWECTAWQKKILFER